MRVQHNKSSLTCIFGACIYISGGNRAPADLPRQSGGVFWCRGGTVWSLCLWLSRCMNCWFHEGGLKKTLTTEEEDFLNLRAGPQISARCYFWETYDSDMVESQTDAEKPNAFKNLKRSQYGESRQN